MVEPWHEEEQVEFLPAEPTTEEELDAIEVMWMERLAKPFTPSPSRPIRAVRCTGVTKNGPRAGRRCPNYSVLGANVCLRHGADLPPVRNAARRRVEEVRLRLFDASMDAAEHVIDLAANSASDAVRLKAATEILDRAGIRGGSEIDVNVRQEQDPADLLRSKLSILQKRAGQVIDGEVVSESDTVEAEQLTLDWDGH